MRTSPASLLLAQLVAFLSTLQPETAVGNKCDEEIFYHPYVLVKRKKNGGDIASLRSSGFLDLRFRNRVILCINGPVVMYSDVERLDPDSRLTPGFDASMDTLRDAPDAKNPNADHLVANPDGSSNDEELRFRKGELAVFNHQCISVNKVPTDVLKKMKEDQGRSNPELMPDTQVMGRLVLGIFLIGNKEGYNKPELAWFKGPDYEYLKTKEKTVKDSSFILSVSSTSHCMRLPDGTHIKVAAASSTTPNEVCQWTVKEEDKAWYSKIFQRGYDANGVRNGDPTLEESDYEFYECPDSVSDRGIILTMSKTTPPPVSHVNYTEFDPFSLFNPNLFSPHGYRKDTNGMTGGDERPEDRDATGGESVDTVICSITPSHPGCSDEGDMETTTLRDMQNVNPVSANSYEIVVSNCTPLPVFDITECSGIGDNGCRLLELTLELEPAAKNPPAGGAAPAPPPPGADDEASFPSFKNLNEAPNLEWKMTILNLVSDIFAQLCMPFRADMPYTLARVFAWYVYKAHIYGEDMGRKGPPPAPPAAAAPGAPPAPPPPPPPPPGTPPPPPAVNKMYAKLENKTDTWIILEKELERCREISKKENNGKGLKFQWEIGDDSGKWKIPTVSGMKRRRRAVPRLQPEYHSIKRRVPPVTSFEKEAEVVEEEEVEEIDAVTGEKILTRQKRSNHPVPSLSNKYILPGKSMQIAYPEGNTGYARETIQEYRPKPNLNDPRADSSKYIDFPENIQHCWDPVEDPVTRRVVCTKAEDIFFYEDRAEIEYELNIAIDLWWKVWATTIGYCNKAYFSRKSETFPRLYNSKYEYFFDLVQKEWKMPEDNDDLRIIFSEYLTEESQIWLDTCLEAAYINSNSKSYRPPRPMTITEDKKEVSNYFEELPSFIYYRYHPEPSMGM